MRYLLVALTLVLAGCGDDNPTITQQPEATSESPAPAVSDSEDITVSAVEYEFEGVPDAVSAGPHNFILEQAGEEPHVFYLFLITGDQSLDELIELPEKEVNKVTQAVDRAEVGPVPGATDEFTADLIPGRFGYICFVTTKDGTPHFALGMAGEFTVA